MIDVPVFSSLHYLGERCHCGRRERLISSDRCVYCAKHPAPRMDDDDVRLAVALRRETSLTWAEIAEKFEVDVRTLRANCRRAAANDTA